MPFIPHTEEDVAAMLNSMGASDIATLFDEIPEALINTQLPNVPEAVSEMQLARLADERASHPPRLSFLGAGAYEHHIPAAIWQLVGRGEFYTAYTPYQAEASQGTLQLLYEWQTMIASLTGMDVANASLYDGATALAEAVLMAVRANRKATRRILLPDSVNPRYREAVQAVVGPQNIALLSVPVDGDTGTTDIAALEASLGDGADALVIPLPNFFGALEPVDDLTNWAHSKGLLVIGLCNPMALALLREPGAWGEKGADIACGDAQPLGIPLSGGGPFLGFMACRTPLVRQLPGRIIGRTEDKDGRTGFTLTLQAREQHIRRSKATSNICTNQGLMVVAATLYLALSGREGLSRAASACHAHTAALISYLGAHDGVEPVFDSPFFHEIALRLPRPTSEVLAKLEQQGILGGYDLAADYPSLGHALLVCATETKTTEDIQRYAEALAEALKD